MKRAYGFTLVEVLVALAVVAIALLALTRAAGVQVATFDALRERTLAGWVAANVVAETRLVLAPLALELRFKLTDKRSTYQRDLFH